MEKILFWFRQDLRLHDNPGLVQACRRGTVLPVYIQDQAMKKNNRSTSASDLWLHNSLKNLSDRLHDHLHFYKGDPLSILIDIVTKYEISTVVWNRCYEPFVISRDKKIKQTLKDRGINVLSFNSALLWEPHSVLKKDGTPYKVFTPYYRKGCLLQSEPELPLAKPDAMKLFRDKDSLRLDDLCLKEENDWECKLNDYLQVGEDAALNKLDQFVNNGLLNYKEGRDFPDQKNVSRLSPHLHFGEVSPRTVWHEIKALGNNKDNDHFLSELGWREFSYYILYHFPRIIDQNLQKKFDNFVWLNDNNFFNAWKKGCTGIPLVDAGMRELWDTGYMHNRVRMVVGSFLVKNGLIDWRWGAAWFERTLFDADTASNRASWQWVAGTGTDAAPFFRIFNPVTQAKKFDPEGAYIKRFVPELANVPLRYLHAPWEASSSVLEQSGVVLGKHYPKPIVDLKVSRQRALDAFKQCKGESL